MIPPAVDVIKNLVVAPQGIRAEFRRPAINIQGLAHLNHGTPRDALQYRAGYEIQGPYHLHIIKPNPTLIKYHFPLIPTQPLSWSQILHLLNLGMD